jgi:signal transduction histidine kinase
MSSARSIEVAQEIELDLLRLNRIRTAGAQTGDTQPEQDSELRTALAHRLSEEANAADTPSERRLLSSTATAVHAYLAAPGDPAMLERRLTDALGSVGALVAFNAAQAEDVNARLTGRHRMMSAFGGAAAITMILSVVGTLLWMRSTAVRPLEELRGVIERFTAGDENVRAIADGPVEARAIGGAFNTMADRLAAHRTRELTILASVAHDLRTPLVPLRIAAEMAGRNDPAVDPARAQQVVRMISRQVGLLERLTTDLLDRAVMEAGRLEIHPESCDLREVAQATVGLFTSHAASHRLALAAPPEPVWIQGDPSRLHQVLTNLVSNAVKYSPHGTTVTVGVRTHGASATIAVADEGPGITAEEQQRIFEPFYRSHMHAGRAQGAGLGLALSRHLIEAHGGRIEVTSAPGAGSTFTVWLPRDHTTDATAQPLTSP